MQDVGRNILRFNILAHYVTHILHLELSVPVLCHESFLEEYLFVKELLLSRQLLETFWQSFVTIADEHYQEVIFGKFVFLVQLQAIVVVEQSLQRCP